MGEISVADLIALCLVWLTSLFLYTFVLTGSLPGLSRTQALKLNLAGSAVSNVVPFGGALGVALGYAMVRSWGFTGAAFTVSTVVSGAWNLLAKLVLLVCAVAVLAVAGGLSDHRLTVAAGFAASVLALVVALGVAALTSDTIADRLTRGLDRAGRLVMRSRGRDVVPQWGVGVRVSRDRLTGLVRRRWPDLTAGILGSVLGEAALLWVALHALGSTLGPAQVFAGFAMGRALTALVVTPGGIGFAEIGTAAVLVASGGDPAISTAGVLVFSLFTFWLEIPAGAGVWLAWMARNSRHVARRAPRDPGSLG
jgi:uncharacterized membrane protein YbhN (UPF0104 family)